MAWLFSLPSLQTCICHPSLIIDQIAVTRVIVSAYYSAKGLHDWTPAWMQESGSYCQTLSQWCADWLAVLWANFVGLCLHVQMHTSQHSQWHMVLSDQLCWCVVHWEACLFSIIVYHSSSHGHVHSDFFYTNSADHVTEAMRHLSYSTKSPIYF